MKKAIQTVLECAKIAAFFLLLVVLVGLAWMPMRESTGENSTVITAALDICADCLRALSVFVGNKPENGVIAL